MIAILITLFSPLILYIIYYYVDKDAKETDKCIKGIIDMLHKEADKIDNRRK